MKIDKSGGPAFPTLETETHYADKGMSLRDYFASQLIAGMLLSNDANHNTTIPAIVYGVAQALVDYKIQLEKLE